MNSKYYHIVEEHEDPPVEGTEGPRGDPFGYGKRKKEGAYREGVNSVTGIPDGKDIKQLQAYEARVYNIAELRKKGIILATEVGRPKHSKRSRKQKKIAPKERQAAVKSSQPVAPDSLPRRPQAESNRTQWHVEEANYRQMLAEKMEKIHALQREEARQRILSRRISRITNSASKKC